MTIKDSRILHRRDKKKNFLVFCLITGRLLPNKIIEQALEKTDPGMQFMCNTFWEL